MSCCGKNPKNKPRQTRGRSGITIPRKGNKNNKTK